MDNIWLSNHILELEKHLATLDTRSKADELSRLLDDDFVEFGASGRRFDKQEIIALLSDDKNFTPYDIHDFKMALLAADTALVTYVIPARMDGNAQLKDGSRRSSIWKLADDRWQLFFHQGTKISVPQ